MHKHKALSRKSSATVLLLINGFLISLMLALGKEVTSAGIHPVAYAFWQTAIATLLLMLCSVSTRKIIQRKQFNSSLMRYCLISGLTGIAVPNAIAFFLVNELGSGFTGIMYALPPIFTFFISILVGIARFRTHKLLGLTIAVLSCTWIILKRNHMTQSVSGVWFALGIIIPVMLSIGNIYRSIAWPKNINAMPLAAGTLLSAAFLLGIYGLVSSVSFIPNEITTRTFSLVLIQGLITATAFLCAFELQKRSDPVFYSQLGSVAAVFGLLIGVLWFDERYPVSIWLGVLTLLLGLRVNNMPSFSLKNQFRKTPGCQSLSQ